MGEHREIVIQTRLGPEKRKQEYYFFSGKKEDQTMIFPKDSGRGVLTAGLQAKKIEGEEIHGYQAWEAEGEIHLYFDRNHWQLSSRSCFGAPVTSAKRRKV